MRSNDVANLLGVPPKALAPDLGEDDVPLEAGVLRGVVSFLGALFVFATDEVVEVHCRPHAPTEAEPDPDEFFLLPSSRPVFSKQSWYPVTQPRRAIAEALR